MSSRPSQRVADLRHGAVVGIGTGLVFAAWAFIVYARAGDGAFRTTHTTLGRLVATYLAIGVVAGALVGGAWRSGRSAAACYLLALPPAGAVALGIILMDGSSWAPWDFETWSLFGVLMCVGTLVIGNQINVRRVARLRNPQASS
jgi:hypothetical protein